MGPWLHVAGSHLAPGGGDVHLAASSARAGPGMPATVTDASTKAT
jgi:hypothetical protein